MAGAPRVVSPAPARLLHPFPTTNFNHWSSQPQAAGKVDASCRHGLCRRKHEVIALEPAQSRGLFMARQRPDLMSWALASSGRQTARSAAARPSLIVGRQAGGMLQNQPPISDSAQTFTHSHYYQPMAPYTLPSSAECVAGRGPAR